MSPTLKLIVDREIKDSFAIRSLSLGENQSGPITRVTYNRIFFLHGSSGALQIDNSNHPVSGNELLLIAKGQVFNFMEGTSLSGFELSFGDCFWERSPASASNCKAVLYNNAIANQRIPVEKKDRDELDLVFNMLLNEFLSEEYPNKLDAMAAYLKVIMIKIANINAALSKGYDTFENKTYRNFVELVSKNYRHTHEVGDFARELAVSARKLSDLCKRCSGTGAKEIINGQLVAEAKRSLQFSSKPVKEIAYDLSFATPEQFSHFFKKNTSVAPHAYRSYFVNIGM